MTECVVVDRQAVCYTFKINRGDTWNLQANFVDGAGDPIPLLGITVDLTVNTESDGSGLDVFALTPTNVADPTYTVDGVALFEATATQTSLPEGTYYYDVQWTSGAQVRTFVMGELVIGPGITG